MGPGALGFALGAAAALAVPARRSERWSRAWDPERTETKDARRAKRKQERQARKKNRRK